MSIWEAFGMGRYKGFSREAGLLLDEAVELAGGFGCKKADTGHLLLAMLQIDHGTAGRFLAGKTSPSWPCGGSWPKSAAARHSISTVMRWLRTCAAPWTMLSLGRRTPTSPAQNRNTCSAPCWRIPTALPGCCWRLWGFSSPSRAGSAASFRVSSSCPASPALRPCPAAAAPATNTAVT